MCTSPRLIFNPQCSHLLSIADKVFVGGASYSPSLIASFCRFPPYDFLRASLFYDEFTPEVILDLKRSSFIEVDGNRFPLFVALSCGRCAECRVAYRKQIEYRALIEASRSGTVVFYTLTYDDEHLPVHGLEKSHVSSAFKRLRTHISRYLGFSVTFSNLYVGEYGNNPSKSLRPHYHGLLFIKETLTPRQQLLLRDMFLPVGMSKFYDSHRRLKHWWPYGRIFDFQRARVVKATVRYCCKYITKQYLFNSDDRFAILKERDNAHWNPPFVQLPKRIGLGCAYLSDFRDNILNSDDMTITVNVHGQLTRIGIPRIFIQKMFPNNGTICPDAAYTACVCKFLLDRLIGAKAKFNLEVATGGAPSWLVPKQFEDIEPFHARFIPYNYLTFFTRRRITQRKLDCAMAFLGELPFLEQWCVLDNLLDKLQSAYTEEEFNQFIQLKASFYASHVSDDSSSSDIVQQRSISTARAVYAAKQMCCTAFDF